ncbi:hypothetical protein SGPA1_12773 [Streptomyces misionensis JCM 4497]
MRLHRDRPARRVQPRQAGLEGRLADALGLRGRDLRAERCGPLLPGVVLPGGRADRRDLRRQAAHRPDVRVRRHLRHGQDVVLARWRADPGGRAEDHGAAAAALAVRAPPAQPVLQDRLRPGDPAAVRRVGQARREGRRRLRAAGRRRRVHPRGGHGGGRAAEDAAPAAVPDAGLRRRHHGGPRGPGPAHPLRAGPGAAAGLAGRGAPALRQGRGVDQHARAGGPADHRARGAGRRAAEVAGRGVAAVGAAAARRPGRALVAGRADAPRVRRAEGAGRVLGGRDAEGAAAGDQDRPAVLLRAAVPAARGPGHRAAAAHAAAGGGPGAGAEPARRVTPM